MVSLSMGSGLNGIMAWNARVFNMRRTSVSQSAHVLGTTGADLTTTVLSCAKAAYNRV